MSNSHFRMTAAALLVFAVSCSPPPELSEEHRKEIASALTAADLPTPVSLEVESSGYLVATFAVTALTLGGQSSEAFATKALLTIRNTMFPHKVFQSFRVTLNGPPPGPGLVARYGSARFNEGGSVEWSPAK